LVKPHTIPANNFLELFQSEVQSAASLLNTTVSGTAGAATTVVSDITAIETIIPRNCSLGTKQFCIRFENKTNCTDFLFNISNIIPEVIAKFVGDKV
jgi:hypothetical protein